MENMKTSPPPSRPPPHVLIFPFPAQGHINPMLKLAEILAIAGLKVTFVNTVHNHNRLVRFTDVLIRFSKYPGFEFKTVPDGLPDDHPRTGDTSFLDIGNGIVLVAKPALKELLLEIKPSVIIGDGVFDFVVDMGNEVEIPAILFFTTSACCLWIAYTIPYLIEAHKIPIRGDEDLDGLVNLVPGMESFLRFRDLPSFCRPDDLKQIAKNGTGIGRLSPENFLLALSPETQKASRAHAFIFNTFEALEGPTLSHIRTKCPNIFSIGPLHAHLRARLSDQGDHVSSLDSSSSSLRKVDRSCMSWLDQQEDQSVVYVSFGSITVMTRKQLMEIWYGLVNSKTRFLWVMRPDFVTGDGEDDVPVELRDGTKERGYMVDWAPQEEVLAHSAIGGFFTHSGWNSTLESLVEGVPMICWPYFGDQQVNSRFVEEVWKLGLDMKDVCDRKVVEKMVNDLMVEKREEFVGAAKEMAKMAKESVSAGGSSYCNLDSLVEDIRQMSLKDKSRLF